MCILLEEGLSKKLRILKYISWKQEITPQFITKAIISFEDRELAKDFLNDIVHACMHAYVCARVHIHAYVRGVCVCTCACMCNVL